MGFYLLVLLFVQISCLWVMMCRDLNDGIFCRLGVYGNGCWGIGWAKFDDFMFLLSLNFGTY